MTDNFEKSFADYLNSEQYDSAEQQLFSAIRAAYRAGWLDALHQKHVVIRIDGGPPEEPQW
jgi:hypothetical protein